VGAPEWIGEAEGASPLRRLTTPLAINGTIYAGLSLRMFGPRAAPAGRPFYDLRANLIATVNNQVYHLGRCEFDPAGDPPHHINPFSARGFAPPSVAGAHHHSFAENAKIGLSSFEPASNLRVALPEDREFQRYDDVLDVVRARFVIPGFWTEDPAWLLLLA
jgi:hypothetical protein